MGSMGCGIHPTVPQGSNRIVVRTTDKSGQVQTSEVRPPFPDRNTPYHQYKDPIAYSQSPSSEYQLIILDYLFPEGMI